MKNTLVPILEHKIRDYVRESFPAFVQYIKDYLVHLEQDDNFLGIVNAWKDNCEPTNEVAPYVDAILRDCGFESDHDLHIRRSVLLHTLRDFYMARGTEESFRYLFRAMFDTGVSIRYPREQMFVASGSSYGERYFLYLSTSFLAQRDARDVLDFINVNGGRIRGLRSLTQSNVQAVTIIHGNGKAYLSVEILRPAIEFEVGETVVIESGDYTVQETVYPVAHLRTVDAGAGYKVGDRVNVYHLHPGRWTSPTGITGYAKVAHVTTGGITHIHTTSASTGGDNLLGKQIVASAVDGGFGFLGRISAVHPVTGAVTGTRVEQRGYNYTELPRIYVIKDAPVGPWANDGPHFLALSSEIGCINSIETTSPFVDFDPLTVVAQVQSGSGAGADIAVEAKSYWTTKSWENRYGFLNENAVITDSDKYQQFSYMVVSDIEEKRFRAMVEDLLHPVGYIRTNAIVIESELHTGTVTSDSEVSNNEVFEFEALVNVTFTSEYDIDENELLYLVTSDNDEIVTTLEQRIAVTTD